MSSDALGPKYPKAAPDVFNTRRLTTTSRKDDGVTEDSMSHKTTPPEWDTFAPFLGGFWGTSAWRGKAPTAHASSRHSRGSPEVPCDESRVIEENVGAPDRR